MELLGDRNWWMPSWLDRILPTVTVEGSTEPGRPAVGPVTGPPSLTNGNSAQPRPALADSTEPDRKRVGV